MTLGERIVAILPDAVPVAQGADIPRAVLLDKSLREYAHMRRREACSAWSNARDKDGEINQARCEYAAAQESYLESAIDELADVAPPAAQGTEPVAEQVAPADATGEQWSAARTVLQEFAGLVHGWPAKKYEECSAELDAYANAIAKAVVAARPRVGGEQ